MFCDNCGARVEKGSEYCDSCGSKVIAHETKEEKPPQSKSIISSSAETLSFLKARFSIKSLSRKPIVISAIVLLLIYGVFEAYNIYRQTEAALQNSTEALQSTKSQLSALQASTTAELLAQQTLINQTAGNLQLSNTQLSSMKAQLQSAQSVSNSNQGASINSSKLLSAIAPAIVKLVCSADAAPDDWQQGSGMLFINGAGNYSVQTNLHVVQTSDNSASECLIGLYPNEANPNFVLLYQSSGYYLSAINPNADVAYITPELINDTNAGTLSELSQYALSSSQTQSCENPQVGDHLWVLGYPAVGGNTLTVTDGSIAGFETDTGIEYIKTDAKIDHGNSGGLAIEDSGCVLGIPTFAEELQNGFESLGRILDLQAL
jgi:S1-C subfamily serine protease